MMKKLLLLLTAAIVLSVATPSYATHSRDNNRDWGFDWSKLQDREWDHEWNEDCEWPDLSNIKADIKEWLEDKDWSREGRDWGQCGNDNPVPEPATAGLSLMGLAALGVAIRRRRK